ncbi:alpha/beta fold hydrolase [Cellulomonas fimi]|nr:alpha/beta fold hydrolase [Cellulomonas fimi]
MDRTTYPWATRTLEVAGATVHLVEEGTGPTLLLLHGNPTWSYEWRDVIRHLRDDFRCVALDLPGLGLSTARPSFGGAPTDHARVVADVVAALDLRDWTLVAHDWGVPIGLAAAHRDPRRLGGLVVANSWAWPVDDDRHFTAFSRVMGGPLGRFGARHANLVVRAMLPLGHRRRRLTRAELRHYRAPLDTPDRRAATSRFAREIVASTDFLAGVARALPDLADVPSLLLWADRDIAFREAELARWRAELPHADLVRLPGTGHFVPSDAPADVAAAIRAWHPALRTPATTR